MTGRKLIRGHRDCIHSSKTDRSSGLPVITAWSSRLGWRRRPPDVPSLRLLFEAFRCDYTAFDTTQTQASYFSLSICDVCSEVRFVTTKVKATRIYEIAKAFEKYV